MSHTQESIVLEKILEPISRFLTPEGARELIDLRADPDLQERVDYLAERCSEGELTPDERREYETYVHAGRFIAILQAKARKLLAGH